MTDLPYPPAEDEIAALRAEHTDDKEFVGALITASDRYVNVDPRKALRLGEAAFELSRSIGYEDGETLGLLVMGCTCFVAQDNKNAFRFTLEAQPRVEALGDRIRLAQCYTTLAGLYRTAGNQQKALEFGHEAISTSTDTDSSPWEGWSSYMVGDIYRETGDLEKASEYFQRTYDFFLNLGDSEGQGRGLIGLATVERAKGDLEAAKKRIDRALTHFESVDDGVGIARSLSDLALVHQDKGEFDEARSLFERSLEIRRNRTSPLVIATCLIDLGTLLVEIDRPDEAIERLSEALSITQEADHKPRMFATQRALADAYAKKGEHIKALAHFQEFQRVKEEVSAADASARLHNLEISLEAAAAQKEAALVRQHNEELTVKNTELGKLLQDLRDAQEMLIQSEKMASLGQLTAGIAHEIKNPLNFVNNFSVMTKDLADELTEEVEGHREAPMASVADDILELTNEIRANALRILEHGKRAGQVVNSMLVHTRHSHGKKTEVDVNALVETSLELAYHGFLGNNEGFEPVISKDLGDGVGTFVIIEEDIARVLTNVFNNAFYATHAHSLSSGPDYEPQVSVQTVVNDKYVSIRISDNGPGIDDAQKSRVFEPFFTTKPTGFGTGLGLSQSYDIITKRHGGSIRVEDAPGGGAVFLISIPTC